MRADSPYKTIEDVRTAKEPPKCGATGVTGPDSYLPKLLQQTVGAKFNIVTGYPGGTDIHLAVKRGEIQCRPFTIEAFFGREPHHTWRKKGEEDIEHFWLHAVADTEHGGKGFDILDEYATTSELQEIAVRYARESARMRWFFFDGIYITRWVTAFVERTGRQNYLRSLEIFQIETGC